MQEIKEPLTISADPKTGRMVDVIVDAIQDKKGQRITIVDLSQIETAPAGAFIVCQGRTSSQVSAIADNIREELHKRLGIKPYNYDGYRNSQWIVIDYGSVMVHVFQPEIRDFYSIEDLWSDAQITEIPDID